MDGLVEDVDRLLPEIFRHLHDVELNPAIKLDEELLKRGERNLDNRTPFGELWRVLQTGTLLLAQLQQDGTPLTRLLGRTVLLLPFEALKEVIVPEQLEVALKSSIIPIQILCLAYLQKASETPSGASFVACNPDLIKALVNTWLASESTEVSERSSETILSLFAVDVPECPIVVSRERGPGQAGGHGLFWRRTLKDPEVYTLFFQWTSLVESNRDLTTTKGRSLVTIAQARLFDLVAGLASLDWAAITTTTHPEIEQRYSSVSGTDELPYCGLLSYVANGMIDDSDHLMKVLRQEFFSKLLKIVEERSDRAVTPRLIAAIQEGAGVSRDQGNDSNGVHL